MHSVTHKEIWTKYRLLITIDQYWLIKCDKCNNARCLLYQKIIRESRGGYVGNLCTYCLCNSFVNLNYYSKIKSWLKKNNQCIPNCDNLGHLLKARGFLPLAVRTHRLFWLCHQENCPFGNQAHLWHVTSPGKLSGEVRINTSDSILSKWPLPLTILPSPSVCLYHVWAWIILSG